MSGGTNGANHKLSERDWHSLLRRIKSGQCTPFLGAGASSASLPLATEIARKWAKKYKYPLKDSTDLARVAQFVAVEMDRLFPKEDLVQDLNRVKLDFSDSEQPHCILAQLPLPVYITTNYDDFMFQALKHSHKDPKREICRWYGELNEVESVFDPAKEYHPSDRSPLVFHLHGYSGEPESLVLTEEDYLDFLVHISRDKKMIPARIQAALTRTSLLFVGYSLADWSFQVLFRGLVASHEKTLRRMSVSVQLLPEGTSEEEKQRVQDYLEKYFAKNDIRIYWGTAQQFLSELSHRWKDFSKNGH